MYNRIKDGLGIEYKVHWQAAGDVCIQRISTDTAAGTLPDMFQSSSLAQLGELIDRGAVRTSPTSGTPRHRP